MNKNKTCDIFPLDSISAIPSIGLELAEPGKRASKSVHINYLTLAYNESCIAAVGSKRPLELVLVAGRRSGAEPKWIDDDTRQVTSDVIVGFALLSLCHGFDRPLSQPFRSLALSSSRPGSAPRLARRLGFTHSSRSPFCISASRSLGFSACESVTYRSCDAAGSLASFCTLKSNASLLLFSLVKFVINWILINSRALCVQMIVNSCCYNWASYE